MKYEVDITRISYATLTFGVEASSEEEAIEKAMNEACNTSFDVDAAKYVVENCHKSDPTVEE